MVWKPAEAPKAGGRVWWLGGRPGSLDAVVEAEEAPGRRSGRQLWGFRVVPTQPL